jgi:hypothetical protein
VGDDMTCFACTSLRAKVAIALATPRLRQTSRHPNNYL